MDSVGDLLGRYAPKEPAEVTAIKNYVETQFGVKAVVGLQGQQLVVTVKSASLATTLRLRAPQIQVLCKTTKKLVFRIG